MGIGGSLGKAVAPHVHRLAPDLADRYLALKLAGRL